MYKPPSTFRRDPLEAQISLPTRLDRTQARILAFAAEKVERHEYGQRFARLVKSAPKSLPQSSGLS